MPILSPTGRALSGVGGGIASIDDQPIHASYQGCTLVNSGRLGWLDADTAVIAGRLDPIPVGWTEPHGIGIFAYHVSTGQLTVLAERASTWGTANGGSWIAYIVGHGTYGSFGDLGEKHIPAIGPDGRAVYTPHAGQPYRWLDDDAMLRDGLLEPGSLQLLGNRQAIASTPDQQLIAFGIDPPQTLGKTSTPKRIVTDAGESWLLCYRPDQARIVLHPWDNAALGYVVWNLITQGPFYGYHGGPFNGGIKVVGARREGEQPGDLIAMTFTLTEPRISLTGAEPEPDPPPDPEPPDPEPEPPVSIPDQTDRIRERWQQLGMDRLQQEAFDRGGKPAIQALQIHFTRQIALELEGEDWPAYLEFYHNPIPNTDIRLEPAIILIGENGQVPKSCKVIGGRSDDNWTFGHPQWHVTNGVEADRVDPKTLQLLKPRSDGLKAAPNGIGPSPFNSEPVPPPDPPPPPPDTTLNERVTRNEVDIAGLKTMVLGLIERVVALEQEPDPQPGPGPDIDTLAAQLAPRLRAKSQGGFLGHSHDIEKR